MESLLDTIKIHLYAAWRRRWYALAGAWAVCLLGWAAVAEFPDQYEVSARLHVDTDAVLVPLLRGLAVDTATASQAELMQKTLLSRANLKKLVAISYPQIAAGPEAAQERLSQRLAVAIQITSVSRNLFTVTYRDSSPQKAYDVVKGALQIFLDNQADATRSDMKNAQNFLREQIASYEKQLSEAERRRADFRSKFFDILPGEGHSPSRLDLARQNLAKLGSDYDDNKLRLDALKRQLATIPQFLAVDTGLNVLSGGVVTTLSPAQQQLFDAEKNLRLLQTRLTDNHPDVIAAKRLVAVLRATGTGTGIGRTPGRDVSNPVYEQVRLQIVDRETTRASLAAQIATAKKEADRLETLAREAPGVEAGYARLDRDYSILQRNYNELVARLEQARIAAAATASSDSAVQVMDPPQLPQVPVAPRRLLLISGVLGLGLIAGAGVIVALEQIDRSFGSLLRLRRVGAPVLGGISRIDPRQRWSRWLHATGFALGIVCLLLAYGGLMLRASAIGLTV